MIKFISWLSVFGALIFQSNHPVSNTEIPDEPGFMSKVAVLSIHVSDTMIHDSVFHFLAEKLGLPVEYYPEKWGERKYAGLFAGNMFLEPCGPFRGTKYARDKFRAIFYGLNCEAECSIDLLDKFLNRQNIEFVHPGAIQITDSLITGNHIFFNIVAPKDSTQKKYTNTEVTTSPRITGIKEIWIGIDNQRSLQKWNDLIYPEKVSFDEPWKINQNQYLRFVRNDVIEIKAIVFKVESLPNTRQCLEQQNIFFSYDKDLLHIDSGTAFGLELYFCE